MNYRCALKWPCAISLLACLLILTAGINHLHAQGNGLGAIHGAVLDQSGHAIQGATVAVISESRDVRKVLSGADGKFDLTGITDWLLHR